MKSLICWLRTRHSSICFVRNIYGDEINFYNGKRSLWRCDNCGCLIVKNQYVGESFGLKENVKLHALNRMMK